jgi:excisionase family DNA binding protein
MAAQRFLFWRLPEMEREIQLLTAEEVARILCLPRLRVYELARQGQLPCVRIGERQIRFAKAALQMWIEHGGNVSQKEEIQDAA